jgi:dihydroneopterin aldolase
VKGVVAGNDRHLLETLADRILQACFEDAQVRHATVTIRKLDLDPAAEGIGIRLARGRSR